MLATYMRIKYPHIIDGSIVSSAPIRFFKGKVDPSEYYQKIHDVYEKADHDCPSFIKEMNNRFEAIIEEGASK